ncbi:Lymphotoxin-alpha [Labeo rohita]|uniref:Lymphotoxin-alpha n=1 Tax=Labeo rohita TaxID=84645 RepID=A0ABQ8MEY8_LABRO|nr:Lymphotoxin-alpha [Labeo rohita]
MANEEAACKVYAVLMEPETVNRLMIKYHSLRRQVCFIQSVSVFFCFSCCLFTLLFHAFPPSCKYQTKDFFLTQRDTSFTRLTVKNGASLPEKGYVPWMPTPEYPSSKPIKPYFILDADNESLKVLQSGTYKLFLQITYRNFSQKLEKEVFLQHEIHHFTDKYKKDVPLPSPLLTYCETVNLKDWRKTMFSEGIFVLESGDRLKVWSNNLNLVDVGDKFVEKTVFVGHPHFST